MPNQRAPGQTVTSVALPRDLLDKARAKAESNRETDTSDHHTVSAVIREALTRFVGDDPT